MTIALVNDRRAHGRACDPAPRVQLMLAVGALVTGSLSGRDVVPMQGLLAAQLVEAGGRLDSATIRAVLAPHCGASSSAVDPALLDALIDLMTQFMAVLRRWTDGRQA